ncbi:S8 family serine peptidase [Brevibacillus migulae]|uniref:S8 family serine peptidase n=1 Tax=Brevibacillus migulae TaxID=1644114 RepID=UPI00106E71C9|nr:S8 family serine peptidase [Brevibacillus migulae]
MRKWQAILSSSIAGLLVFNALPVDAKSKNGREMEFDNHVKVTNPIPKSSKEFRIKALSNAKNDTNLFMIRFAGPIQEEWKEQVEDLDVSLGWYLPDYTYIAKLPDQQATVDKLEKMSFVKQVAEYKPVYKVHPDLAKAIEKEEKLEVYVESFDPQTEVARAVQKAGGTIRASQARNQANVEIDRDKLEDLLQSDDVVYVAPVSKKKVMNDVASQIIGSDKLQKTKYDGKQQIVSVVDTGLDTGDTSTMHADLRGQVSKLIQVGPDARDFIGHGTHVLGSIVGKGTLSNGKVKGMAPGAKAVVYTVDDGEGNILNFDYNKVWTDAYKKGARIHSMSIGSYDYADYTYDSQQADIFLWEHPDAISLVAAGNEALEYSDEFYTVATPATSKNAVAVGASESYRPLYGADSDDEYQVAAFSSRGPTSDGRIKPDIVAPGTSIFSTRSAYSNDYEDISGAYGLLSGTSMATPITAGGVAQIRQYLQENGTSTPSGALIKALLIAGAEDLGDSVYRMGFGRVNLPNSIDATYVDQQTGIQTDDTLTYEVEVKIDNDPFNVTLVWTDYPASLFASRALVNDLDLVVTTPSGEVFNGNDFSGDSDDERDNLNNVEQVYLPHPEEGTYTISVTGFNVPKGPQPFALASSGEITPALIDATNVEATATLSKDSIKLAVKGKVDSSVNSVKVNAPGIKNATAKVSKSGFSLSKSVKAGSYPIEEIEITAATKKGEKQKVTIPVEVDLIDDDAVTVEETETSSGYQYNLESPVSSDIKAAYYLLDNKLVSIRIEDEAIEATFASKKALKEIVLVVANKKGNYEVVRMVRSE